MGEDYSASNQDSDQDSEDVEQESVDSVSEDELDNWEIDESSIIYPVVKQEDCEIEIVEGPSSTSPQAESTERRHETPRENSRKTKRVSSEASFSDPSCQDRKSVV